MNDLADARMRNLYWSAFGALILAGAIVVGCANSADASERHHPQPRPAVKNNLTAKPTANARSESGGNSLSTDGDKVDVGPTVSFSEDYPDLMPVLSGDTVTNMDVYKAFLFGYAKSKGVTTDAFLAVHLVPLFGKWFATPRLDEAPYTKDVNGYVVKTYTREEQAVASLGRGMACSRFGDVIEQTMWAGQCK